MQKYIVCITGGIASGKSLVADRFLNSGFSIIDADLIARQIVRKDSECLQRLVEEFGSVILNNDKTLNRNLLKQIVFKDPDRVLMLNKLTHPVIDIEISRLISITNNKILLVIPLLNKEMVERYKAKRVVVVDVSLSKQITRVKERDGVGVLVAQKIIESQMPRSKRLEMASDIIVNNGSIKKLYYNCDLLMSTLDV